MKQVEVPARLWLPGDEILLWVHGNASLLGAVGRPKQKETGMCPPLPHFCSARGEASGVTRGLVTGLCVPRPE
ncbi:hypothetical protein SKAU_G00105730 [Synaphobranchus kaupii]|uniref:Uncharacterized protein n=1 Tax=Synaphobranchus kaupii TaxID=118154 RepID=A0A9Q1J5Q4_SYNKA|nr:hypothetical protein SKAU_G00105730 [Synaphobranchus kaupii]